ncbi:MAG: fructose-6-phosphate aldolase [Atopobiaceae bacterium]|jgi:fructose-6-phosphate aldolase 1|nr:fructose-6-phosphate aldolase [Atopobiaceae bacterium]
MELILDTADAGQVRELSDMLTITGVTTNPTIITRSGKTPEQVADDMLSVLSDDQLLFMQTVATDFDGIMADARRICSLRPKSMYVKIPVTHEGLRAIKAAKAEGLGVLATAIYSADEAFLAAMNGADYLAPYVNRMENYGDGVGQVEDLLEMLAANGLPAKVVAASFKNAGQVHELVRAGIQAVTVPPEVVYAMVDHPGTGIAVGEFSAAWRAAYGRDTFAAE